MQFYEKNRNCCLQLSHGAVTNEFLIKQHLEQLGIITAKKPVRDQQEVQCKEFFVYMHIFIFCLDGQKRH